MALNLDQIVRIQTRVTGGEQVQALGAKIAQVEGVTQRLTKSAGILSGALGTLAPIASIAGLTALVKGQIEAGDKMNDLSQRTGVSVEALAKFGKAASLSGTDLDSVSKALAKLSKGLYEAGETGKGPTKEALDSLGISAIDAAGKLKTADQVTLEIANKFKEMPDGVEKTALAMKLFGKAGAEMIPMLNEGGTAIDKMSTKMTAAFAKKADEYNDKLIGLTGKVKGLAMGLTESLLPSLIKITDILISVIESFNKLPEPIKTATTAIILFGIALKALEFTGVIAGARALIAVLSGLGTLGLGATIAGWLGAVGPFVAGFQAAMAGLLAWVGGTLVPGLIAFFTGPAGWLVIIGAAIVAALVVWREPIGEFLAWVGGAIAEWAAGFGQLVNNAVIQPIIALWESLKEPAINVFRSIDSFVQETLIVLGQIGYEIFLKPWVELWKLIEQPVTSFLKMLVEGIKTAFTQTVQWINETFIKPWGKAWELLTKDPGKFVESVKESVVNTFKGIQEQFGLFAEAMAKPFMDAAQVIKNVLNSIFRWGESTINSFVDRLNGMVVRVNTFTGARIPTAPRVALPRLARGGFFNRSTIAEIGEAGPEYAIPERGMPAAIQAYQQGRRGAALIQAMQSGGLSPGSSLTASSMAGGGGPTTINLPAINLQVAQAVQLPSGDLAFSASDVQAMIARSQADTAQALWQMMQSSPAQAHQRR